jgi:hypothetical protein
VSSLDKYEDKYCVDIYKNMAAGLSDTQVMAKWDISRSTFYRWMKEHPELKEAQERGKVAFDAIHESLGVQGMMKTTDIDYQFWRDLGKYRHGWAEKQSAATMNTQINIDTMNVLNEQTNEELLEYIKGQMEKLPELKQLNIIDMTDD